MREGGGNEGSPYVDISTKVPSLMSHKPHPSKWVYLLLDVCKECIFTALELFFIMSL